MDYLEKSFISVARAIQFFSSRYENVCIPLRHSFSYDMIGVRNGEIHRIKVFRTECTAPSGSYVVNLRKSGGYNKANTQKKPFDPSMCDQVFVDSPDGIYVIPSSEITQSRALSLSMFKDYFIPS